MNQGAVILEENNSCEDRSALSLNKVDYSERLFIDLVVGLSSERTATHKFPNTPPHVDIKC